MLPTLRIGSHEISDPVLLAPMAGITDAPFRAAVRKFGAGLVVSEMVASQELVQDKFAVRAKADLSADGGLTSVQLAGREAEWMARAARFAEDGGAPIIDINMGCPAKKVTSGYSGSALMRHPDHALSLIDAVVGAVAVPVTLKMRLGWDDDQLNAPEIARRAENAGVRMIVVHGRTRCQFYKGAADWTAIRSVKEAVTVPVIANGDIVDAATARTALEQSGADGVMIGRGAQARPWIVAQISAELAGRAYQPPGWVAQGETLITQYEAMIARMGVELGVRCARKHLGWRLEIAPGGVAMRAKLMRENEPARVVEALRGFYEDLARADAPSHAERAAA